MKQSIVKVRLHDMHLYVAQTMDEKWFPNNWRNFSICVSCIMEQRLLDEGRRKPESPFPIALLRHALIATDTFDEICDLNLGTRKCYHLHPSHVRISISNSARYFQYRCRVHAVRYILLSYLYLTQLRKLRAARQNWEILILYLTSFSPIKLIPAILIWRFYQYF